jgi:hypothetical protein
MFTRIFALTLALLAFTAPARAAIIQWNLENVHAVGNPAVTVTGFFDFDTAPPIPLFTGQFSTYEFTVSGLGGPPFTLTRSNTGLVGEIFGDSSLRVSSDTVDQQVQLDVGGLSTSIFGGFVGSNAPLISSFSYVVGNNEEFNLQGSILDVVPLPAALPLFGSGVMVLAGFAVRRRGKVSA